jgi:iron(III) transport system substrate-binding protein
MKRFACLLILLTALPAAGCWRSSRDEVVVYAALDREFSQPVLDDYEQQSSVAILAKYDVESTKTVGLVSAIIQERNRPRCDVFWNNEILHTLRLEKEGLLAPLDVPELADWPNQFRSPTKTWHGLAARARVIIVNTKSVPESDWPRSIEALADPKWKGKCGLAKPLFGTTATHAAVLFAAWGNDRAEKFFRDVKQNAQVLSGNKQVALAVAGGQLAWGITDTDDAIIEKEQGQKVEIIFPDQGEGQIGCLLIPNTIAVVKNSPHADEARQLAAWLLDPANKVEERLAAGPSAQIPVHPRVKASARVAPENVRPMQIDFAAAAEKWDQAAEFLRAEFTQP